MESYLRTSPPGVISAEKEPKEEIMGEKDPDQLAANRDITGK